MPAFLTLAVDCGGSYFYQYLLQSLPFDSAEAIELRAAIVRDLERLVRSRFGRVSAVKNSSSPEPSLTRWSSTWFKCSWAVPSTTWEISLLRWWFYPF